VPTSNGKKDLIYPPHKQTYRAERRRDYWIVCESKKDRISVEDYAKKYCYSVRHVQKMCQLHILKAIKFKTKWLVLDQPVGG
jgi:hypothetical protein